MATTKKEEMVTYSEPDRSISDVPIQVVTNSSVNVTALPPQELYYAVGITLSCIAVVGIIFNLLNLYVLINLLRRRRGVSPTYHLLIAMGMADLLVLLFSSFFFLNIYTKQPPIKFRDLTEDHADFYHVLHYVWTFFVNPFSIASNWLVVATTVFRFLAVAFPMRVCQWCTLLRMRLSIVLIFFLSLCINIPHWFTVEAYTRDDGRIRVNDTELYSKLTVYYFVYHVMEIYVPFLLDFILVIFLIINLNKTASSMANSIQDGNAAAREKEHRKIGIMLIAIVLWFLFCQMPVIVYQMMRDTSGEDKSKIESQVLYVKLGLIKNFGPLLNHAGNIVFYCLCNNTYRRMFVNTLLCRKRPLSGQSQHTTMTQASTRHEYVARLRESRRDQHRIDRTQYDSTATSETAPFIKSKHENGSSHGNGAIEEKEQTV